MFVYFSEFKCSDDVSVCIQRSNILFLLIQRKTVSVFYHGS